MYLKDIKQIREDLPEGYFLLVTKKYDKIYGSLIESIDDLDTLINTVKQSNLEYIP